jgi:hypothetical protein
MYILRLYYNRCTASNYIAIENYFYWVDESTEDDQSEALGKCMDGGQLWHLARETAAMEQ